MNVTPFTIAIPDAALTDLRDRLRRTRWPDEINDDQWSWGTRRNVLRELVAYWIDSYDWRAQEAALNQLPHFRAEIGGLGVHFVHVRGSGPNPTPLLITHGWPGSFIEMRGLIPLLSSDFDLVIPSLPGYGFSDRPARPGFPPGGVAALWIELMHGLGYQRFGLQGGDWGAMISASLAQQHPRSVIGLHLNFLSGSFPVSQDASEAERAYFPARSGWVDAEGGYSHIQGTKPQTLAYALTDSPTGLAGWILEKFRRWSDCNGDPFTAFSPDDLLTNISIYWLTETISSSIRIYRESRLSPFAISPGERITPPLGFAAFPKEIPSPPRDLLARHFDLRRYTIMPRGGHFAAMEAPDLLAGDVRAFFQYLR
jgi:pimeloyl-ACP methyl ester carboxylesterase